MVYSPGMGIVVASITLKDATAPVDAEASVLTADLGTTWHFFLAIVCQRPGRSTLLGTS